MSETWSRVDRLVDACLEAATPEVLIAHGVGLVAAHRLHETGQPVPVALQREREVAAFLQLAAHSLLLRLRALLDGPMILIKGPEVAAHYPDAVMRSFGDLDILVPDSASARRALLRAGFVDIADYEFPHTQRPLRWPGCPLLIELHHALPWLPGMHPPAAATYFSRAIPSRTGIAGIETLPEVDHALLVAAHAWKHAPLNRLGDLLDVTAMADGQDGARLRARARQIGLGPVWDTTQGTIEELLSHAGEGGVRLPLWARHLYPPRQRSVFEAHLARWVGSIARPTPTGKLRAVVATLRQDMGPLPGEPWSHKMERTLRAVREARRPSLLRRRAPSRSG